MSSTHDLLQAHLITARRAQILDAAAKVFSEKGFHITTIRDISREAGIADGTIYHYFNNKGELLTGIFDRLAESVQQSSDFPALAEGDLHGFLKTYISRMLSAFQEEYFALFRIIVSEIMVNGELRALFYQRILEPMLAMAQSIIQQWAAPEMRGSLAIPLTVRAVSGMVLGIILERTVGDPLLEEQWDELSGTLADLILHGLR